MKGFSSLTLGLLAAMLIACPRASAQQFDLSVTPSSDSILISNSLTYTINVTNNLGVGLTDVLVTNILPMSAQFLVASNYYNSSGTNWTNVIVFELGSFPAGIPARLTVTAQPTAVGFITNTVIVSDPADFTNIITSTSVVVQVTNTVPPEADLGVTMTGPKQVVITNDWMTYGVTVTNAGPDTATGVILTNILPSGVIGISPSNQISGSNSISLGTLISGGSTTLQFTVEPTNIATLSFSALVGSGALDTNTANNFANTNITVTNYLPAQLVAYTNSAQLPDAQVGYLEQTIVVSNIGPNAVPAVRLVVSGLTNKLANAVGTNGDTPFVVYGATLDPNRSVNLLLQFSPNRTPFPFANSQLHPFAVSTPDLSAPPEAAVSTNINLLGIFPMPSGGMLLEFPSIPGKTYTVVYSSGVSFTNAYVAQPSIVAPANYTFWIDYGPPATLKAPTNAPMRFYRVYQNP